MSFPWQKTNPSNRATMADFSRAADKIGCEVAVIRAVWKVEAAGRPFRANGTLERRFEPHHFPKQHWGVIGFNVRQGEKPWRASVRLSNDAMAERAYHINPEAMMTASSFGAPQIMGFNHRDCGYSSAAAMVADMAQGEPQQLDAFVRLIIKWNLASALRAKDWKFFANRYNGPGQVERYAGLMAAAFRVKSVDTHAAELESAVRKEGAAPSKVVLRIGSQGEAVKVWQRVIGAKDDGVFGTETERLTMAFQKAKGLKVDGVVGDKTWGAAEAMKAKVAAAPVQDATSPVADRAVQVGIGAGAVGGIAFGGVAAVLPIVLVAGGAFLLWRWIKR